MSDGVEDSASGLLSDTVLLQLIARRSQTPNTEQLPAPTVNSTSTVDHRQSAAIGTKATRYNGKTAGTTDNSRPATICHKLRQTRSSTHDYRHIAAAITSLTAKHCKPTPSPVDFDIAVTATEAGEAEFDHTHPLHSTCLDGDTCRSSKTSHSRLPVKCRISKPDVIADMGITHEEFTWLREVGRCLNPHRRHQWSD